MKDIAEIHSHLEDLDSSIAWLKQATVSARNLGGVSTHCGQSGCCTNVAEGRARRIFGKVVF
jgi:hypothetical protein